MIVWLTGLPCSGKTTIARALADRLNISLATMEVGRIVEVLDGDDLRNSDFSRGTGFDRESRRRHLLRTGYMAKQVAKHVPIVVCSFVSPFKDVRSELPIDLLVYVRCPAEVCAKRDVKGMWAKAQQGEIVGFTGHDAPYEVPENPDVVLDTDTMTVPECVDAILQKIYRMRK